MTQKSLVQLLKNQVQNIWLSSCIERGVIYLNQGDLQSAKMSFLSDIRKSSELNSISNHLNTAMIIMLSNSKEELIRNIEGLSVVMSSVDEPEPEVSGGSKPGI